MGKRKYTDEQVSAMVAFAEARLRAAIDAASPEEVAHGKRWYSYGHEEARLVQSVASDTYGRPVTTYEACSAIAVLSPLCQWAGNLSDAFDIAAGVKSQLGHSLPANQAKARRIFEGEDPDEILRTRKVYSFAQNLFSPRGRTYVTTDGWMADLFGIDRADVFGKAYIYDALRDMVVRVARDYKLLPLQAQAVAWVHVRNLSKAAREAFYALPCPY